ncbi:hypothetical protein BDP27DRAFT_293782 [Rhodocollybia butyracea]|uniref:Uncharacterized protein n=1 Tax=Rhodocollybia butyracea TaxID=206335 RepID=A0A9P5PFB6_9AGAR|nr:hypothetical protein BDP27DRAFT_293782 [Rhodocollybia butyracea]
MYSAVSNAVYLVTYQSCRQGYLWHAKLLHHDISITNIVFHHGSNDRVYGVLNNFDHAIGTTRFPSLHQLFTQLLPL